MRRRRRRQRDRHSRVVVWVLLLQNILVWFTATVAIVVARRGRGCLVGFGRIDRLYGIACSRSCRGCGRRWGSWRKWHDVGGVRVGKRTRVRNRCNIVVIQRRRVRYELSKRAERAAGKRVVERCREEGG